MFTICTLSNTISPETGGVMAASGFCTLFESDSQISEVNQLYPKTKESASKTPFKNVYLKSDAQKPVELWQVLDSHFHSYKKALRG